MNLTRIFQQSSKDRLPMVLFTGLILFSSLASFGIQWNFPLPFCGLKRWTGIPCPFCSGTHSAIAWLHLKWLESFLLNPLVFFGSTIILIWFGLWIIDVIWQKLWASRAHQKMKQIFSTRVILFTILFNWLYLCWKIFL